MRHRVRIGMSRTSTASWSGDSTIESEFSDEEHDQDDEIARMRRLSAELSDWVRDECVRRTKQDKGV